MDLVSSCQRCYFFHLGHLARRDWAEYLGLPSLIRPIRERMQMLANMGANSGPCSCGCNLDDPSRLPPP
jgi:hypothetical protein